MKLMKRNHLTVSFLFLALGIQTVSPLVFAADMPTFEMLQAPQKEIPAPQGQITPPAEKKTANNAADEIMDESPLSRVAAPKLTKDQQAAIDAIKKYAQDVLKIDPANLEFKAEDAPKGLALITVTELNADKTPKRSSLYFYNTTEKRLFLKFNHTGRVFYDDTHSVVGIVEGNPSFAKAGLPIGGTLYLVYSDGRPNPLGYQTDVYQTDGFVVKDTKGPEMILENYVPGQIWNKRIVLNITSEKIIQVSLENGWLPKSALLQLPRTASNPNYRVYVAEDGGRQYIYIYDNKTGKYVTGISNLNYPDEMDLDISPDGTRLIFLERFSNGNSQTLKVFDLVNKVYLPSIPLPPVSEKKVKKINFVQRAGQTVILIRFEDKTVEYKSL